MGKGAFSMFSKTDNFDVSEAMASALDACFRIFLFHNPDLRPVIWWRGFLSWSINQQSGTASVSCKFWFGNLPSHEYHLTVKLERILDRRGYLIWRPVSVSGFAPNLSDGRFQEWTMDEDGAISLTNQQGWIPYFPTPIAEKT